MPKQVQEVEEERDQDQLIQMTFDGENYSEVPLRSFRAVWEPKGWREVKSAEVERAEAIARADEIGVVLGEGDLALPDADTDPTV